VKIFLAFLLIFLLSFKVVIDTDYVWHLRAGEYIIKTKSIPKRDLFSFSAPDYPYVYHSWASEVIIAASYKLAGNPGVSAMFAALAAFTIFVIYKTCFVISKKEPSLALFVLFAPAAYAIGGGRTRSFGFLAFAILYLLFSKFSREKSPAIWLVPVVFFFWANLHGSFILGIFTLLVMSALAIAADKNFSRIKTLFAVNLLSVAATLINPYFIKIWQQTTTIAVNYYLNLQFLNLDWQSLTAKEGGGAIFAAMSLILTIVLFLVKNKIDLAQKLMLLIFLALSTLTARFAPALFVFFLVPLNQLALQLQNKLKIGALEYNFIRSILGLVLAVLLLTSFLNVLEVKFAYTSPKNYAEFLKTKIPQKYSYMHWPYDAGIFVSQNLQGKRVLNEANWGSLLLFLDPKTKVFYYGAMDNFIIDNRPFILEYLDIVDAKNNWEAKLQKYKVDAIFLPNSLSLVKTLKKNSQWEIVYIDNLATVMVKK